MFDCFEKSTNAWAAKSLMGKANAVGLVANCVSEERNLCCGTVCMCNI
jgi:hypothetical protein